MNLEHIGRPLKYGAKTKTLQRRIPITIYKEIAQYVDKRLAEEEQKHLIKINS